MECQLRQMIIELPSGLDNDRTGRSCTVAGGVTGCEGALLIGRRKV